MSRNPSLLGPDFSRVSTRSRTLITSSSATYLDDALDDIGSCNGLLHTLIDAGVAGPLFFRLQSEFDTLEEAGQSDVLKAKSETVDKIQKARRAKNLSWFIDSVVIKRHRPRTDSDSSTQLARHFLAARREVLALSHDLFQNHPNIVQLQGWGFCLDTVEQPKQQSLQVPLLILERAEADLEHFLQYRAEKPLPTTPYLRIRLCRDVGAGLEILHKKGFTHGDLKPKNILVFKSKDRDGWTAKLCDFGCAQWHAAEPPAQTNQDGRTGILHLGAATYYGTTNWLPPEVASRSVAKFDHETLQRCDIFVYGMVVWSVLCNDGKSCRSNDVMEPDQTRTRALRGINKALRTEIDILSMIRNVLEECLCDAGQRALKPWAHLRRRSLSSAVGGTIKQMVAKLAHQEIPSVARTLERTATSLNFRRARTARNSSFKRPNVCQPLTPDHKAQYESQEWWSQEHTSAYGAMLLSTMPQRPEDSDFRSTSTFHEPRGRQVIEEVHDEIVSLLGQSTAQTTTRLYCCARLRSRFSLSEWMSLNINSNLVEIALTSRPTPELSTLAWLCRGEVGSHEVKTLACTFNTWDVILNPNVLNESERLERFLLLLQSGAEIQQELPHAKSRNWTDDKKRSILFEYIRSCRRAVVGMVMREILSQFKDVKLHSRVSEDTTTYLTGQQGNFSTSALGQFVDAVNYEAVYELHSESSQNLLTSIQEHGLSEPLSVMDSPETYRLEYRRDAQQIVNLLLGPRLRSSRRGQSQDSQYLSQVDVEPGHQVRMRQQDGPPLPGWEVIRVDSNDEEFELYQDVTTRSITLEKPCVNLADAQVRIGYQDQAGRSFYLHDLSSFFQSDSSAAAFKNRFPIYSTEWFKGEQGTTVPTEDILGTLRDRWRIPSLTESVDITWVSYFFSMWPKILSISWVTLLIYGIRVLPLAALMVHKAR